MDKKLSLKQYLKDNILITDGATGTYYSQIAGADDTIPEIKNRDNPKLISRIHQEYIEAGAKLIRTNTFSVNSVTLGLSDKGEITDLIEKAYKIAKDATLRKDVYIAANIGPIPESGMKDIERSKIIEEYKYIIDVFLNLGADIFNFETFGSTELLEEITGYIKLKREDAFILTQFAVTLSGYTRREIAIHKIINQVKEIKYIDAYGFNCGTGPVHLYNMLKNIDFKGDIVSVLPNSGYPEIINERTVFSHSPKYFAEVMNNFKNLGVKILGGCCGTTPEHIRQLAQGDGSSVLRGDGSTAWFSEHKFTHVKKTGEHTEKPSLSIPNVFYEKLKKGEFAIAAELDPPFGIDLDKLINGAKLLKSCGADIITIADSPLSRVRADSLMVASKIIREVGIEAMPHIACRDKNVIALKSGLLAAYTEGIRNILAVTGDPIPESEKSHIKSVFNINSMKLIELIKEMNNEHFMNQPYNIGGALNLNVVNPDAEILRMKRKVDCGANFFMTQPIFSEEKIKYLKYIKETYNTKVLAGIMPIVSYKNAQFLNNEIPGIKIPEHLINRFDIKMPKEKAVMTGIEIAIEICEQIREYVDGFYFITPFNRSDIIAEILKK